jgi:hypothetical protein
MGSVNNWVSGESNAAAVENAQMVLNKIKREKYGRGNQYRLEKIGDHPATYREVLVVGEEQLSVDHTPVELEDDGVLSEVNYDELAVDKTVDEVED